MNLRAYIRLARVDHWAKHILIIPGVIGGLLSEPSQMAYETVGPALAGLASLCLIASSSYVVNEILDAERDRHHPQKQERPLVSGEARKSVAYVEWVVLTLAALGLAAPLRPEFFWGIVVWFFLALGYNCPPVRTKEVAYLDVLSEALNNPLRLGLGWFAVTRASAPPSSLLLSYWLLGAFLMSAKRLAELRTIGDQEVAARYRSSFAVYTQERLATAMLVYAAGFTYFLAIVTVKYRIELVLGAPLLFAFLGFYCALTYEEESPVQAPESLFRTPRMIVLSLALGAVFLLLASVDFPQVAEVLELRTIAW